MEPLLHDLLDPKIQRKPAVVRIRGKEIRGYIYEQKFDQRYVHHLLEILLSIVQFGGQGFAKTSRSTPIKRIQCQPLAQRMETGNHSSRFQLSGIYLLPISTLRPKLQFFGRLDRIIITVCAPILQRSLNICSSLRRFIQSEPKEQDAPTMEPLNTRIQSTSIDILQAIVARGEVDHLTLETLEPIIIGKLYFFVHLKRLDVQNRLLRILHSLISASTVNIAQTNGEEQSGSESSHISGKKVYTVNSLLTHTLMDGIAMPHNRPVLQHWLDFVLMAIPQFQPALQAVIPPLVDCICRQLRSHLNDAARANQRGSSNVVTGVATDAEFVMLLNTLERLLVLGLANYSYVAQQDEDTPTQEKAGGESSGILGYVSNVFTSETISPSEDQASVSPPPSENWVLS